MIDDISLNILKIIQNKARIPNVEVARKVGMAPSAVLERIRKLEKQGFIDGYEVRLNPKRFNRGMVGFVHVTAETRTDNNRLGHDLAAMEEVQEVHFVAGNDGYLVKIRVADAQELDRVVRGRIAMMPGVAKTQTLIVTATMKETTRIPIGALDIEDKK